MDAEKQKQGSRISGVGSLVSLGVSIAMLCVGIAYDATDEAGLTYCDTGAATYLYYGGILGVIMHGLAIIVALATCCAQADGEISGGEACGLGCLGFIYGCGSFCTGIGELILLIWGSVVVLGSYATWTDERPVAAEMIYCEYTPMMFAFVLIVLKWVLIPLMCVCGCLAACCGGIAALTNRGGDA